MKKKLSFLLIVCLLSLGFNIEHVQAAPTLVTSATITLDDSGPNAHTWTGTLTTPVSLSSNSIITVCLDTMDTVPRNSGVQLNNSSGAAFTQIGTTQSGNNQVTSMWYIKAASLAASTAYTFYVDTTYSHGSGVVSLWDAVDQTTPIGTPSQASYSSGGFSLTPSSNSSDIVTDCVGYASGNGTPTKGASQTLIATATNSQGAASAGTGASYRTGGSTTVTWTGSAGLGNYIAVALKPAGGGTTVNNGWLGLVHAFWIF